MEQQETNLSKVKSALESGLKLSVISVLNLCQTIDARKYISMLRQQGMDIKSEWVQKGKKSYKVYWLSKE
jgi:hypothetical protein